ncbi:MAG: DUF1330 domain-containing protein [Ignavibacteriales bacterium]|nr:DUF1330 domain-containing protein [Ignavibacteriales bacterium]
MKEIYLTPTQEAGYKFIKRDIKGNVIMLNLLRFKEVADYSATPELMSRETVSGREAYKLYINHTLPFLKASGGDILFMGEGGNFIIGPEEECWDAVLLVKQKSIESFLNFESHEEYLKGIGHRTAALEDSRLLPITESENF